MTILNVALRKESVDRNPSRATSLVTPGVALRKESVDRNTKKSVSYSAVRLVALRKESVDRNNICPGSWILAPVSLSARRAWIEIQNGGGVRSVGGSLSARRAWIEIWAHHRDAPRKSSLSARRAWIEIK